MARAGPRSTACIGKLLTTLLSAGATGVSIVVLQWRSTFRILAGLTEQAVRQRRVGLRGLLQCVLFPSTAVYEKGKMRAVPLGDGTGLHGRFPREFGTLMLRILRMPEVGAWIRGSRRSGRTAGGERRSDAGSLLSVRR